MQFIHLISQIVLQTREPVDKPDERLRILPTLGILKDLVQSWSESIDESKIEQLINDAGKGDAGMNSLSNLF